MSLVFLFTFFICRILILDLSVEQWDNWIIANFSVYGKFNPYAD